jgi:hypothetical protein
MISAKILLGCGLCALVALGAETGITGPTSGFIFQRSSQTIRPILGVPGSAHLGASTVEGFENASVSPLGTSALATRRGVLYLVRGLQTGQLEEQPVVNSIPAVSRFAWSPDGESAAVYSADSRQAQIIRTPQAPAVCDGVVILSGIRAICLVNSEAPIDLAGVEGAVSALVFDGKRLLIGGAGVYVADPSGLRRLMAEIEPGAMTLGGGDVYIADQKRNQIWLLHDYAGAATPMLFADERSGISTPTGIGISANGHLLVANAGSRSVDALDIATRGLIKHIELEFAPGRMEAIGTGRLSLLNFGGEGEPLYLLDSGDDLAVYFVPDAREEE